MKKRAVVIACVGICLVIFAVFITLKINKDRRDGMAIPDAAAETDISAAEPLEESSVSSEASSSEATISFEKAQSVETLILNEAVIIEEGDIGAFYSNEDFENVIPTDIDSFSADNLPDRYDSRDVDGKSYITSVENQGYTYLCWTYACLGAIEADILRHHQDISHKDLDLSEKHIAYYNMHRAEGSKGGYIDDDFREFVNANQEEGAWIFDYDTNYIAAGGVTDFCISLMTAWKGPVQEKDQDAFKNVFGSKEVFRENAEKPSEAYGTDYHVQAVEEIPSNFGNNMYIKQMIMEHGAVTIGICAGGKYWKGHDLTLNSDFGGNEIPTADHEVMIVGWDDNYAKEKFAVVPEGDGAWICRNSWGEKTGENGYFYLSYYDDTIGTNNAAGYKVSLRGDRDFYDNNYQAAGFLTYMVSTLTDSDNFVTAYSASTNPYGMVYKADSDERLEAIGLMGLETYQQYEFDVYINPRHGEKSGVFSLANIGTPDVSWKGEAISGGYHTYELPRKLSLAAGDEFLILVRPVTAGKLVFENATDSISAPNYDEWKNLTGSIHNNYVASGCSYYISENGDSLIRQDDKDFFVKAYTIDQE